MYTLLKFGELGKWFFHPVLLPRVLVHDDSRELLNVAGLGFLDVSGGSCEEEKRKSGTPVELLQHIRKNIQPADAHLLSPLNL